MAKPSAFGSAAATHDRRKAKRADDKSANAGTRNRRDHSRQICRLCESAQPVFRKSHAIVSGREFHFTIRRAGGLPKAYVTRSSFCRQRTIFGIGVSGKLVFQLVTPTSPR